MDLTEFLEARIAEDEAAARAAMGWQTGSRHEGQPLDWSIHMDRWSPDRVLAECEAERRIVELHKATAEGYSDRLDYCSRCAMGDVWDGYIREYFPCDTIRALALPYADHPDYREEWRP